MERTEIRTKGEAMGSITATAARKDLYNIIARVNEDCAPITIANNRGKALCSSAKMTGQP